MEDWHLDGRLTQGPLIIGEGVVDVAPYDPDEPCPWEERHGRLFQGADPEGRLLCLGCGKP